MAVSALALTIAPVAAQAAPEAVSRASAATEDSDSLTTTGWVLVAIGGALLIWGIIELTNDDDPSSP